MGDYEREVARENPGLFEKNLELFRHRYERGEKDQAIEAMTWCVHFGLAVPDWLGQVALAAMRFYHVKKGGNAARARRAKIDVERYRVAEKEMALGRSREEAFECASIELRGTPAQGSEDAIEESHTKISKVYPRAPRKPGPKPRKRNSPGKSD